MFEVLPALPADPILGLSAAFKEDTNPKKIDLGVGVYKDENGNTPILESVIKAQRLLLDSETTKTYIAPQGVAGFLTGMKALLFGASHPAVTEDRITAVQTPGGTGALRLLAELIARGNPDATVWVSDPTWANHIPIFETAGLRIEKYPYFDKASRGIRFDAMMETLNSVKKNDIVLLHGCCHNPTGQDLNQTQWQAVLEAAQKTGFIPFIDVAYQGFGDGLDEDAYGIRLLSENLPEMILSASCSKNFGLYRERTGMACVVTNSNATRQSLQTQIQSVARANYSMPPSWGAAIVDIILNDEQLKALWQSEVTDMRTRMKSLRAMLVQKLKDKGASMDFDFVNSQKGMFSFLCISPEQVKKMRADSAVYFVDSSRVNIAGISQSNVDDLAEALVKIL
ncbi:aromatic amino acid transaminase [Planctobacterium marinum]|uniref:Aminotransferase n=1 Tax=Planctobacterium marinum TaxID=1631968 RepID=A0AA48HLZ5_9ALTE|nr:aminotransferase [Planctobacterium marinum]